MSKVILNGDIEKDVTRKKKKEKFIDLLNQDQVDAYMIKKYVPTFTYNQMVNELKEKGKVNVMDLFSDEEKEGK